MLERLGHFEGWATLVTTVEETTFGEHRKVPVMKRSVCPWGVQRH